MAAAVHTSGSEKPGQGGGEGKKACVEGVVWMPQLRGRKFLFIHMHKQVSSPKDEKKEKSHSFTPKSQPGLLGPFTLGTSPHWASQI